MHTFKIDDKVTVRSGARSLMNRPADPVAVRTVVQTDPGEEYGVLLDEVSDGGRWFKAEDLVPAPDPSKVKAGDTVTVRHLGAPNTPMRPFEVTGEVYDWGGLHVAGLDLSDPYVTLTAHRPAPEPEPEWKPGTVYDIETVRGEQVRAVYTEAGFFAGSDDCSYVADEVEGADPLVVIDPDGAMEKVAEVLRSTMGGAVEAWYDNARMIVHALGIDPQN